MQHIWELKVYMRAERSLKKMFIDTHAHIDMMVKRPSNSPLQSEHFESIKTIIQESEVAGVTKIINIGTGVAESLNSIAIAKRFENVWTTVGIHPCDLSDSWRRNFDEIVALATGKQQNKIVGIGETGLDFYHKPFNKQRQADAFRAHIELALKKNLPLVVHMRDSADETLKVLEEYAADLRGVNHCFCQEQYVADQLLDWGFYLGIDAPITYPKNHEFREIVKNLPLDSILLETDAPFLAPQQHRGKQNSPAYIPLFAQTIADLKDISLQEVASKTTENAESLFGI